MTPQSTRPRKGAAPGLAGMALVALALVAFPAASATGESVTLTLSATEVVSCGGIAGVVTLPKPVPTGAGVLLAADSDVVTLPSRVDVAPGARQGVFVAEIGPVRSRRRVRITATWGADQATALLVIRPPVAYAVDDLGTLGGATSAAMAINAAGQVAGVARDAQGRLRGFVTDVAGRMRPVGAGAADGAAVYVTALNDAGRAAGWIEDPVGGTLAFVSDAAGTVSPIHVPGAVHSRAFALNNAGEAAGGFTAANGQQRAFHMSAGGSVADLGTFSNGSFSYAFGLSPEGSVVGYADDNNRVYTFRTQPGERIAAAARVGPHAYGYAVNSAGATAGEFYASDGYFHAFRAETGGQWRDLGTLPGHDAAAYAINGRGDVAGASYLLGGPDGHAFLYTDADGLRDLNDLIPMHSGWELVCARALNDAGEIAGYGRHNGAMRAFRLKPLGRNALFGDVNADGIVSVADARLLLRSAGGLVPLPNAAAADVAPSPGCRPEGFGDGRVDLLDALRLLRRLRGLEPAWP